MVDRHVLSSAEPSEEEEEEEEEEEVVSSDAADDEDDEDVDDVDVVVDVEGDVVVREETVEDEGPPLGIMADERTLCVCCRRLNVLEVRRIQE
ncbi:hypothetical protein PF005_g18868 [Phytophthora fragariae]|uniref:Uncharacterized protein n=1 Tax=Phytophthora fragariae TaxID=53985 RepID=A0A6A3YJN3_9STRA|nr:hypothetical protein PF003_g10445 [Phytophthora fragariae]KAE9002280.1 hypothetical protein PF011_g13380 [Phytophthora fragariae]KAE9102653.1 hypothetical protein PF007_g14689 [Phytophthora fragariae]KAE9191382.1 hypothetical protein PF005_g18868 [Phytophthora fragariae]KAE9220082.1 hypothetical protein PF004_g13433 [Phytophthora fragariae]